MGWQSYAPVGVFQMDLAMPDSTVNISQLEWTEIFPIARSIVVQTVHNVDSSWTLGLQNNIIYGVPQNLDGVIVTEINVTALTARCGLVPNLTLSYENSDGQYQISFLNWTNNGTFLEWPICE